MSTMQGTPSGGSVKVREWTGYSWICIYCGGEGGGIYDARHKALWSWNQHIQRSCQSSPDAP